MQQLAWLGSPHPLPLTTALLRAPRPGVHLQVSKLAARPADVSKPAWQLEQRADVDAFEPEWLREQRPDDKPAWLREPSADDKRKPAAAGKCAARARPLSAFFVADCIVSAQVALHVLVAAH